MAAQSKLSPQDPQAVAAVRAAKPPRRAFFLYLFKLLLQHTLTTGALAVTAPFIIIKNIFPFLRKHPLWSFKTAVFTELVRITIIAMGLIRFAPIPKRENGWRESAWLGPLLNPLTFSSHGVRIMADKKTLQRLRVKSKRLDRVWFNPPPVEMLRGILSVNVPGKEDQIVSSPRYHGRPLIDPSWAKARCRGYWYMHAKGVMPPLPSDTEPRKRPVLLYTHGGAGVSFAAGDAFMGDTLTYNLARTAEIDVFTVDYDLAPHARYPTTLVQLLGAYVYLTKNLRYDASQIYFGGDSYGAFSTLLFNRYLRDVYPLLDEAKSGGKPPATPGLILFSPWLHLDGNSIYRSRMDNEKFDIITRAYGNWGIDDMAVGPKYIKTNPLSAKSPWLSPVLMDADEYKELPPLFVCNGGAETLLDEGKEFVEKARKAGVPTEHFVAAGMVHDFYTNPAEIGEAKKHYRLLKKWIASHSAVAKTA